MSVFVLKKNSLKLQNDVLNRGTREKPAQKKKPGTVMKEWEPRLSLERERGESRSSDCWWCGERGEGVWFVG